jgi:CheY-like chemotaxis protein
LLTVAQPTASGVIVKIGVNDEIMRSFDLLITSGARQIELKTDLTPEEPTLRADLGLFGAALLNLMINARDAMPDGGILTVRTRTHFDQALGGPVVAISVTDTGFGMSPELQAKIFAPFFTTKGDAGSGLGLSMVRKFVEQAGGRISLASIVGRGTTFTLIFPLDSIAHQKFEPEVACTTNSGRAKPQRVMVMDVDAAVSEAISMVLRDEGFSVLSTTNGDLALSALAQDEYALAIIDPSGLHVPTALFDIGLPILVLSSALQSLVRNESPVLEKPFNAAALLRAVRHAAGLQPPQPSLFTFTQA